MRSMLRSLCARLALAFLALFVMVGVAFLMLANWSNNRYYEEVTQNLNKSLAMYIAQREPLIHDGKVNQAAMQRLADLVMVVNPIVEVYLLDASGNVVADALPKGDLARTQVDLAPIKSWLDASKPYPIIGDDPRSRNEQKVFSAWPVTDGETQAGYLYVVLGGQAFQTLSQAIRGSYIAQLSIAALVAIVLFALVGATFIFAALTKPLRQLAQNINQFQREDYQQSGYHAVEYVPHDGDEIAYLERSFCAMRERIRLQLLKLQEGDQLRRELISNVSHDLRTPLASMQGYLEMLLLPSTSLDDRTRYISVAFKHCRRLTQLVKELFELSKLDAGRTQPSLEQFSLAELLQDVAQKFMLNAEKKGITISVPRSSQLFMVNADIALIERVLENLIDNALRYTPPGGSVELSLLQQTEGVEVSVSDTGIGVPEDELPLIFERYYRAPNLQKLAPAEADQGTGLGLAIVKRILELHGSKISVESRPDHGSRFSFPLPGKENVRVA